MKNIVPNLIGILISITFPFIIIQFGDNQSLSAYWDTAAQPLFIIMNMVTAYFLVSSERWQFPALLLLLITAFNFADWPILHNVFAISFFVTSLLPIALGHRFHWYLIPYIIGGVVAYYNFLIGEIICVETLCAFHLHSVLYKAWLLRRHKKHIQTVGK
jgi:hypothetical protein